MSAGREWPRASGEPWPGEVGAERLQAAVLDACASRADFPARLEAALRAALDMLASDPDLAYQLTVQPYLGNREQDLAALQCWVARFGDLLRDAAAAYPAAGARPRFAEPFLIGGIRFQIARMTLGGEAGELGRLLPSTLEFLLGFYVEPPWGQALARAALDAPR
jgi:hypothetical protein